MRSAQVIFICALFVFFKTSSAQVIRFNKAIETPLNPIWGWSILINGDSTYTVISGNNDSLNNGGVFINIIDEYGNTLLSNGFMEFSKIFYPGISNSGKRLLSGTIINVGSVTDYTLPDAPYKVAVLYKFGKEGDAIFKKYYGITHETIGQGSCVTKNDNVLLLGSTYDTITNNVDVAVIKTDSSGNEIWAKKFGGSFYDATSTAIEYAPEKFMVFCHRSYAQQYGAPWILKLDSSGNLIQQKLFYNIPNEPKFAGSFWATIGINQNIVIHGYLDTTTVFPPQWNAFYPAFVGTMDTSMNLQIIYAFDEPDPSKPYIIKQIKDSSYVAIGFKYYSRAGFISKISPSGQLLWEREYVYGNQYNFNYFADFEQTYDGGFILTGSTRGDLSQDMWLVKLDSLGLLNDSLIVNTGTVLANSSTNILQLYPNPAKEQLHLKIFFTQQQITTATLTVYDMLGKQIISENINLQQGKANHTVNVSNLPNGNYIAIVQAGGEVVKQRFVRE